jgi:ubiquinone biosynthesis protein COQ9
MSSEATTAEEAETQARTTRDAIVEAALPHVAFDGWTMKTVAAAAEDAGYRRETAERLFPGGVSDVLRHWSDLSDRTMLAEMAGRDLSGSGVRDRVAAALRARIEVNAANKEAVRRAVSHLALPHNTAIAVGNTLRTIDAIWYAAGDTATDFSYYSKRALLTPVYVASVLYWIDDESEDFADTWAFIGRRLDDILRIPRLTSGLRRLANPRSWFSGSRVGNDWEPRQPA